MADVQERYGEAQAASGMLWNCLGQMCRHTGSVQLVSNPHCEGRAIGFLREHLVSGSQQWLQDAEIRMRSVHASSSYADALAAQVAQIRAYQASAPVLWRLANDWTDASPNAAAAAINSNRLEILSLGHALLRYANGSGRKATLGRSVPATFYEQRVHNLGGAWHFVTLALALMMSVRMRILFDIALARYKDEFDLRHDLGLLEWPGQCARLVAAPELWAEPIAPRIALLGALSRDLLEPYALDLQRQARLADAIYADARSAVHEANQTARQARTEAASLRTRLEQSNRHVGQISRQLEARIAAAQAQPASTPKAADERDDSSAALLRQARRELELAQTRGGEQEAELLMLREFCALLLEPPSLPDAPAGRGDAVDLREARVVVVGGRDRFHQKLRKRLPRGVFLHPDLAACPADVFVGADCVVFCTEYSSHALIRAAIDQARRQGLRAAYANHTNLELVLQVVRDLLGQP